jgi:hypothetical protein
VGPQRRLGRPPRGAAEGLRELRPDLVAFQEAIVTDDYDQVADLLGPDCHLAHQGGREADGSGCSMASRWLLGEIRERDLFVTPRVDPAELAGRMTSAKILVPDPLADSHKPSFPARLRVRAGAASGGRRPVHQGTGRSSPAACGGGGLNRTPSSVSAARPHAT